MNPNSIIIMSEINDNTHIYTQQMRRYITLMQKKVYFITMRSGEESNFINATATTTSVAAAATVATNKKPFSNIFLMKVLFL